MAGGGSLDGSAPHALLQLLGKDGGGGVISADVAARPLHLPPGCTTKAAALVVVEQHDDSVEINNSASSKV
jgi:hypothetical protein